MKRLAGYGLLGLGAYLFFMLLQTPAAWMIALAAERLPGFTVQEVRGSALAGAARGVGLRGATIASLHWRWRPLALFEGRIGYRFELAEPDLHLEGAAGVNRKQQIRVADLNGHLPVAKAIALAGRSPLSLIGTVELDLAELRLNAAGRPQAAEGMVRLRNLRSTFPRLDLGDFDVTLHSAEQGIVGEVKDAGGPLELIGTLTLDPGGGYRFTGQAVARDPNNRELSGSLRLLGRPGKDGKSRLDFSGRLQR